MEKTNLVEARMRHEVLDLGFQINDIKHRIWELDLQILANGGNDRKVETLTNERVKNKRKLAETEIVLKAFMGILGV